MSIGPERARLRQYLQGATPRCHRRRRAQLAHQRRDARHRRRRDDARASTKVRGGEDGDGSGLSGATADAVLAAFETSATSMQEKAVKIRAAGEALQETAEVMRQAEEAEAKMAVLEQPPAYSPPTYSPGAPPHLGADHGRRREAGGRQRQDGHLQHAEGRAGGRRLRLVAEDGHRVPGRDPADEGDPRRARPDGAAAARCPAPRARPAHRAPPAPRARRARRPPPDPPTRTTPQDDDGPARTATRTRRTTRSRRRRRLAPRPRSGRPWTPPPRRPRRRGRR